MASRFQEVYRLPPKQFITGCPVLIEAGAMLKDTNSQKIIVQLKLRNISEKTLECCKVAITAFEPNGNEVETVPSFAYLDLNAAPGAEFGSKSPIFITNNQARRFCACVTEAIFPDGEIWLHNPTEWNQISVQKSIVEWLDDAELQKQFELEAGNNSPFVPQYANGLFQCSCGAVNLEGNAKCHQCGRKPDELMKLLDIPALEKRKDIRLEKEAAERAEAERAAAEAAEAKKIANEQKRKKFKRAMKICLPLLVLGIALAYLTPNYIVPAVKTEIAYRDALSALENGDYDTAKNGFTELGTYRESETMVLESQYQKALSLISNADFENGIKILEKIREYQDSESKIELALEAWHEADYQAALELKLSKKYAEAEKRFLALKDYKDSAKQAEESKELQIEANYQTAIKYMEDGNNEKAVTLLKNLKNYKDGSNLFAEASYRYGCQLLDMKKYSLAINQFYHVSGYKDVASKLLDAKYGFVTAFKNNANTTTYSYLMELISAGYPGAKSIYNELYKWTANIYAINTSNNDKVTHSLSLSKYNTWVFHFELEGGAPGEKEQFYYKMSYPDGSSSGKKQFDSLCSRGSILSISAGYETPVLGSTGICTLTIYDSNGNSIGSASVQITN